MALATAAIVLAAPAAFTLASSTPRLTTASAGALARRDALAGAGISGGDAVKVTGCRPIRSGAFTCRIELIPAHSSSRCRWTDTIQPTRSVAQITYSRVNCSS